MNDETFFYVQCVSGNPDHIIEAVPGTELEDKCKKHAEAGFLDALCLGYDECPACVEESREKARMHVMYLNFYGCPMEDLNGDCKDDCSCKSDAEIADSPFVDQVRHVTVAAG